MFSLPNISLNMPSISIPSVLITASAMLFATVLNEVLLISKTIIPQQLRDKILSKLKSFIGSYYSQMTIFIDEHINGLSINEMFEASEIYLRPKLSPSVERLNIYKSPREEDICFNINPGEKIMDTFEGVKLTWKMILAKSEKTRMNRAGFFLCESVERRSIELRFHKKYREKVLSSYLPYVLERSKAMKVKNNVVKLYTFRRSWTSVNLKHPSTFDTLAMDPILKRELIDDLDRFVKRRDFYQRVGKAWKRGYFLYGPPGTGKSSLIAAIANHLKFHIYELELARLGSNSELKNLLLSTANQSILVTLSMLLNFIDGLWSSCGDERIIIITTNHKDKLDPALLRPGRMDMHIHMSYCTPCGFKILASNYLGINNHSMFTEIEKLIVEVEVTTAEIAEEFMKSEEADIALGGLLKFLHMKKTKHEKAIAEREQEVNEQAKESQGNKGVENKREEKQESSKKGKK